MEDGVTQTAIVNVSNDGITANPPVGVVTMEAVGQPVGDTVKKDGYRRECDSAAHLFGVVDDNFFVHFDPGLCTAVNANV
jgi:hypothetical protein